MFDVALKYYFITPANEPKLTTLRRFRKPSGVSESARLRRERYPEQSFEASPKRSVSLLVLIFKAILLTYHFLTASKHARVISILKLGKDPALPASYRPISLLDTIGKIF